MKLYIPEYKKVNSHTRAPKEGRWIKCPQCAKDHKVYHFGWSALNCTHCDTMIEKYDWYTEQS